MIKCIFKTLFEGHHCRDIFPLSGSVGVRHADCTCAASVIVIIKCCRAFLVPTSESCSKKSC